MAQKRHKAKSRRGAPRGNQYALGNRGGGRLSAFRSEYTEIAKRACEKLGYTDSKLAIIFGVTQRTIDRWKIDHPEFLSALKAKKEVADEEVKKSLYHRATGFSHDATKIIPRGNKPPLLVPYREHFPPDTAACIFWLKNRQPDLWRDKIAQEVTGADGSPLIPIINISGRPQSAPPSKAVDRVRNKRD